MEDSMPVFITQGRYTQDAVKGMLAKPEDRAESVAQFFAKAGGKMIAYYLTFGEYDFLVLSEGPSLDVAAAASIVAAAGGGVTDLKTTIGMTSNEMKNVFVKAGDLAAGFKSAGAKA
jgi:uncharacterized protein with GYD domain